MILLINRLKKKTWYYQISNLLSARDYGGSLVAFPFLVVLFMMLLFFVFNIMYISYNKHHAQLALDAATRAAVVAVDLDNVSYVKNNDGSYHVYTPLDRNKAVNNYVSVLEAYEEDVNFAIEVYAVNPMYTPVNEDTGIFLDTGVTGTVKVWNGNIGDYVNTTQVMKSNQQYEAGVFTLMANVRMENLVGMELLGLRDRVSIKRMMSQSSARGKVIFK